MAPVLSTIVVSYNSAEYLRRCLATLTETPSDMEIILVDNASTDGSPEMVRNDFPGVHLVEGGGNIGFGAACNRGAARASGEFFLLLNSDVELRPDAIETLINALKARPIVGVACPELLAPGGGVLQMSWGWDPIVVGEFFQWCFSPQALARSPFRRKRVAHLQRTGRFVPYACGAAMLVRRAVFEELGGMDEEFVLYFEDADFCRRARERGWTIFFEPGAKAIHHLGKSSERNRDRASLVYRQSQWIYYRKYGSWWQRLLLKNYLRFKFWRRRREERKLFLELGEILADRARVRL